MAALKYLAVVGFLLAGTTAFAAEKSVPGGITSGTHGNRPALRVAQLHWHFLGCVASRHQCAHLAHSHGFHHHRIFDDHHGSCHHPPSIYACLGGN